jgi:hypothetical protein
MSFGGRAASSSGCAIRPRGHETGSTGYIGRTPSSSPTGLSVMATAEHREPCESRGSCTVLGAPGGETPPGDSTLNRLNLSRHPWSYRPERKKRNTDALFGASSPKSQAGRISRLCPKQSRSRRRLEIRAGRSDCSRKPRSFAGRRDGALPSPLGRSTQWEIFLSPADRTKRRPRWQ